MCCYCGIPVPGEVTLDTGLCTDCRASPPPYDWARGWGSYQGDLRRLIHHFKFDGWRRLAAPLGDLLAESWRHAREAERPDWIVPIPCHKARRRERGFDQANLLARRLSRLLQIPLFPGLWRRRATRPQPGLRKSERLSNLRRAFSLKNPHRIESARILIVDDVMTSGTTVAEAARVLKEAGAVHIGVVVVARATRLYG